MSVFDAQILERQLVGVEYIRIAQLELNSPFDAGQDVEDFIVLRHAV